MPPPNGTQTHVFSLFFFISQTALNGHKRFWASRGLRMETEEEFEMVVARLRPAEKFRSRNSCGYL